MDSVFAQVDYRSIDWIDWLSNGRYRVGSDGSVWSLARGEWKQLKVRTPRGKGPRVRLTGPTKQSTMVIASLVCRAFHGPRPIGCEPYRFPDPDPRNNRSSNLRWAPKGARRIGIAPTPAAKSAGHRNLNARVEAIRQLRVDDIPRVFDLRRAGWTHQEIADELMTSSKVISSIINGRVYSWVACDRSAPAGLENRGDRHPAAKLTSLDIPEIKEKRRAGMTFRAIAQEHGVSYNAILQVIHGRTWAHVADGLDADA